MKSELSFKIETISSGAAAITPCVDGVPLSNLVASYEAGAGFAPSGNYGGLVPAYFRYGPLNEYFLGQGDGTGISPIPGEIFVLGCACHEVGCWPLIAKIQLTDQDVIWQEFRQPHRPAWNYFGFGPFISIGRIMSKR